MEKVKSFLIPIALSLAIPFLSSCSNDDEDGSIRSGGTNLVGTWAEISTTSDGKQNGFFVYIIKADCSIAALGYHSYNYDDGYLIDPYYTQQALEERIEEESAKKTYKCTFSNNTFYWEGDAMAKITVIDSETVKMKSVHLGNATLKKIKRMVGKADLDFLGFYGNSESLVGKLKLTTDGGLKNAAAALFLRDTSQFPQFLLRMARFRGNDKTEFIDNQRAYGNFFTLLDAGMAFFFKHLSLSGKIVGFTREEKLEIPAEALREALTNALCHRQFHNTSSSVGIAIYDDRVEIENTGHLPDELTVETIKQSHHSFPQNPTIADVLFKTTFLENWGSGVGRMVDACREANLPEPEFNQNAAFVWVTFKRTTINAYNHTSSPYNHTTIQVHHTTSKEQAKNKRLKKFLMAIGENGANLKALMDDMDLRNRSSFVNTYIAPNLAEGYIAMLYPESPNHPMQSYYLTNKGRELLERL